MAHKIRVWDVPNRIFHWLLVLSIFAQFITGNVGGDAMVCHLWTGYFILPLLLFR